LNVERTWLVGYDFTPAADAALATAAADLAAAGGGRLVVVHAHTVPIAPAGVELGGGVAVSTMLDLERGLQAEIAVELAKAIDGARRKWPTVTFDARVHTGGAAETLLHTAEAVGAARIVVGTHGRRGAAHLLLGSVAERVVRMAKSPVLVVKENA
jgi:nucleotide-binding universal stress UspA family protein